MTQDKKHSFQLAGTVVSNKMTKTLVVKVDEVTIHPKYHKRIVSSKKYKVHVPDSSAYTLGQKVEFVYSRPISKDKKWVILSPVKSKK